MSRGEVGFRWEERGDESCKFFPYHEFKNSIGRGGAWGAREATNFAAMPCNRLGNPARNYSTVRETAAQAKASAALASDADAELDSIMRQET